MEIEFSQIAAEAYEIRLARLNEPDEILLIVVLVRNSNIKTRVSCSFDAGKPFSRSDHADNGGIQTLVADDLLQVADGSSASADQCRYSKSRGHDSSYSSDAVRVGGEAKGMEWPFESTLTIVTLPLVTSTI